MLAAVAGVLAVAVVALGAVYFLGGDDESTTTADPGTSTSNTEAPPPAPTGTFPAPASSPATSPEQSSSAESSPAEPPAPAPAEGTLAQGEPTTLGLFDVAVTRTVLDANVVMAEESAAVPVEGRFVLVYLAVTNNGDTPLAPYSELSVGISGTNGTTVTDSSCLEVAPDDMFTVGEVDPGESAEGSFCIDLDPALLEGARLTVAHRDGDVAAWELGG